MWFKVVFRGLRFKNIFVIVLCSVIVFLYVSNVFDVARLDSNSDVDENKLSYVEDKRFLNNNEYLKHNITVQKYYENRKDWQTSNLGSMLFKNEYSPMFNRENTTFVVLIWKYYNWLKERHINNFGNNKGDNPLEHCSVKNCKFIGNDAMIDSADVVVVHVQHGVVPNYRDRNPKQIWVFLSDESPRNSFSMARRKPDYTIWDDVFNWAMTYRIDADVPVPYGRTIALDSPLIPDLKSNAIYNHIPHWNEKKQDVLVSILISNCRVTERMKYLQELQKHIAVDVYGRCSKNNTNVCPGHFRSGCNTIDKYLFYLVMENSKCRQYITEKSFSNAYAKGAIPIMFGPPYDDCEKLFPPHSFLHADNYETPKDLAEAILHIAKNKDTLLSYHRWRYNFEVVNEHGFLGSKSQHYCRLCQALNYNVLPTTTYNADRLKSFFDPSLLCT